MSRKLVYGVGLNDVDYKVSSGGKSNQVFCKIYSIWKAMLQRCYSPKSAIKFQSYIGCSVHQEWLSFSNFKSWVEQQDWEGKQLDKDLLVKDNKVYGPHTCVFISRRVNNFIRDQTSRKGLYPTGVAFRKNLGKYSAKCDKEYLGCYGTPEIAHEVYRKRKHEIALELSLEQDNPLVAEALLRMYPNPDER